MKTATGNRPLTAFEVYSNETVSPMPVLLKRGKIKKNKKKNETKKVKKAAVISAQLAKSGNLQNVKVTSNTKVKKGKLAKNKVENVPNGIESNEIKSVKKKKKKTENVSKSVDNSVANRGLVIRKENGELVRRNEVKKTISKKGKNDLKKKNINDKAENKLGKDKTKKSGTNDLKKNRTKLPYDGQVMIWERRKKTVNKNKKADLKRKINKVKQLISKEAIINDQQDSSSSFDSIIEQDGYNSDDEFEEAIDELEEEGISEDEEMAFSIETYPGKEIDARNCENSRKQGQETFQWIISPYSEEDFFSKYWEKEPLLIKRKNEEYYKGLFSSHDLDKILHEQVVLYSKNLDVTSYSNGKRETHNPIGQAHAPVVWDYYNNGCSLRMLNPQTFHPRVWKCLAALQEHFNSFCGANVYLTPPDTQGFAPHWDDIEAFVLQLEGKKRWRVYAPRSDEEVLPEISSPNLSQDTIGTPILDTVLEPGDLLYFPRGYIHQGHAAENEHSLHITLSTFQKNTWGHYLEKLLPHALSVAMTEDVEFRRGLPRDYLNYMGIVHMENESEERTAFKKKVCDLVMRMLENAPYDTSADQRGAAFMHDCLPPYLTQEDKECSAYGGGEKWCKKKKKVINRVELQPDTPVRLIRGNCIRLVAEEENVHIYHCLENSREYHKEDPQFLEVTMENAPAIETLIHTYPNYVPIESLPLQDDGEKMTVASGLWERGLLVTAHPLDAQYDD